MYIKKTVFYLMILFSLSYVTSCAPPAQDTTPPARYDDSFYNVNYDDLPLHHLPLIKPIRATRRGGPSSAWGVFLPYGMFVPTEDNSFYAYNIEGLEKFSIKNGVIMAYSAYVDKDADAYIQNNYYHWFVLIPDKKIAEGFHTKKEFNQYIQTLGIQDPDWQKPDEAYKKFAETGCLEWIPDCK